MLLRDFCQFHRLALDAFYIRKISQLTHTCLRSENENKGQVNDHRGPLIVTTILIAEDEARISAFIAKGLQRAGYQTQIASDGDQALKLALSDRYDLMLLDIGLPGLDGWSVLHEIRTRSTSPPVIVVTALDGTGERSHSLELGANEYVTKPFRFDELLSRIRRYV